MGPVATNRIPDRYKLSPIRVTCVTRLPKLCARHSRIAAAVVPTTDARQALADRVAGGGGVARHVPGGLLAKVNQIDLLRQSTALLLPRYIAPWQDRTLADRILSQAWGKSHSNARNTSTMRTITSANLQ